MNIIVDTDDYLSEVKSTKASVKFRKSKLLKVTGEYLENINSWKNYKEVQKLKKNIKKCEALFAKFVVNYKDEDGELQSEFNAKYKPLLGNRALGNIDAKILPEMRWSIDALDGVIDKDSMKQLKSIYENYVRVQNICLRFYNLYVYQNEYKTEKAESEEKALEELQAAYTEIGDLEGDLFEGYKTAFRSRFEELVELHNVSSNKAQVTEFNKMEECKKEWENLFDKFKTLLTTKKLKEIKFDDELDILENYANRIQDDPLLGDLYDDFYDELEELMAQYIEDALHTIENDHSRSEEEQLVDLEIIISTLLPASGNRSAELTELANKIQADLKSAVAVKGLQNIFATPRFVPGLNFGELNKAINEKRTDDVRNLLEQAEAFLKDLKPDVKLDYEEDFKIAKEYVQNKFPFLKTEEIVTELNKLFNDFEDAKSIDERKDVLDQIEEKIGSIEDPSMHFYWQKRYEEAKQKLSQPFSPSIDTILENLLNEVETTRDFKKMKEAIVQINEFLKSPNNVQRSYLEYYRRIDVALEKRIEEELENENLTLADLDEMKNMLKNIFDDLLKEHLTLKIEEQEEKLKNANKDELFKILEELENANFYELETIVKNASRIAYLTKDPLKIQYCNDEEDRILSLQVQEKLKDNDLTYDDLIKMKVLVNSYVTAERLQDYLLHEIGSKEKKLKRQTEDLERAKENLRQEVEKCLEGFVEANFASTALICIKNMYHSKAYTDMTDDQVRKDVISEFQVDKVITDYIDQNLDATVTSATGSVLLNDLASYIQDPMLKLDYIKKCSKFTENVVTVEIENDLYNLQALSPTELSAFEPLLTKLSTEINCIEDVKKKEEIITQYDIDKQISKSFKDIMGASSSHTEEYLEDAKELTRFFIDPSYKAYWDKEIEDKMEALLTDTNETGQKPDPQAIPLEDPDVKDDVEPTPVIDPQPSVTAAKMDLPIQPEPHSSKSLLDKERLEKVMKEYSEKQKTIASVAKYEYYAKGVTEYSDRTLNDLQEQMDGETKKQEELTEKFNKNKREITELQEQITPFTDDLLKQVEDKMQEQKELIEMAKKSTEKMMNLQEQSAQVSEAQKIIESFRDTVQKDLVDLKAQKQKEEAAQKQAEEDARKREEALQKQKEEEAKKQQNSFVDEYKNADEIKAFDLAQQEHFDEWLKTLDMPLEETAPIIQNKPIGKIDDEGVNHYVQQIVTATSLEELDKINTMIENNRHLLDPTSLSLLKQYLKTTRSTIQAVNHQANKGRKM